MSRILEFLPLAVWVLLWLAGGWFLSAGLFRLRRVELAMVGCGIGLVAETWLGNLLAHWIPAATAFWLAAILVFVAGSAAAMGYGWKKSVVQFSLSISQWLALMALLYVFVGIGRGLAAFEDYQNLPTISLMATGDVPPHFALDPHFSFNYHYFLLLFAAQLMLLGRMYPWNALDLAIGLALALPLVLAGLWSYRMVQSRVAAFLTGILLAFAGGVRWLLLVLPPAWLEKISRQITLIGSAGATAPDLAQAMISNWKIDGDGPLPFPFAFHSGIFQSYIMGHTGISGSAVLIVLLLLLTAQRWRSPASAWISAILLSALALANEVTFGLIGLGFITVILAWMVSNRSWRLPRQLLTWFWILCAAGLTAILQGGMLTEIVRTRLSSGPAAATSYFDATPSFVWPPAIISAHFGSLSVTNPAQLFVALLEIGPIVLALPLVIRWGLKSLRLSRWYEASLIATLIWSLPAFLLAFKGPIFTATPRLLGGMLFACALYGVPLCWIWSRGRDDRLKAGLLAGGLAAILSGLVLFGMQLLAMQKPVYSSFISELDVKVMQRYWNQLEPGSLVLDPTAYRAPTVFGRATNSSETWYVPKDEWTELLSDPNPAAIAAAGYRYFYFDIDYWEQLTPQAREVLQQACVRQLAQVDGIHGEQDYHRDFRRLLDVSACR